MLRIQEFSKQFFMRFANQPILWLGAVLLLLATSFWGGVGLGYGLGRWSVGYPLWTSAAPAQNAENGRPANARVALAPKFELFWETLDLVYRDFYGTLPDAQKATYDAIRGVVNNLGDPNTSFMTPQEANYFRSNIEGAFEGIGARVEWNKAANTLEISEPFENQPAWKAGVRRGDLILAIDTVSIVGTNLNDAVAKIRGPKGSKVTLTIQRTDVKEPLTITVVRDRIETPTISTDSLGKNSDIAYVRLFSFNQNAGQLVRQAVANALTHKPRALIFDLRGNPGGLLREAVKVANVFIQDQTVVIERSSDGKTDTFATEGKALTTDLPVVILVNEGSASASEIVAGALQDGGRARLIGAKTYGKGSVQLPYTLSDGSILRVTVAHWFTPKNRTIHGTGLTPDTVVAMTPTDHENGKDPQLDAAVEYLTKQSGQ